MRGDRSDEGDTQIVNKLWVELREKYKWHTEVINLHISCLFLSQRIPIISIQRVPIWKFWLINKNNWELKSIE